MELLLLLSCLAAFAVCLFRTGKLYLYAMELRLYA